MKILICGDRNWTDREKILGRVIPLPADTTIINGGCRGADSLSSSVARELGLQVVIMCAEWGKHGKAAGPIRNRQMLDEKPDLVIAFHSNLEKSKGTADTVREAKRRGIPVEVIT